MGVIKTRKSAGGYLGMVQMQCALYIILVTCIPEGKAKDTTYVLKDIHYNLVY